MTENESIQLPLEAVEKYSFSRLDRIMAWVTVVLGYLFIRILPARQNRLAAVLFLCALWGTVIAWLYLSGIRPTPRSCVFAGGALEIGRASCRERVSLCV